MHYIQNFDDFVFEKINYKNVIKNIEKDLNFNITGLFTYGASISAFLPIVEHLINNKSLAPLTEQTIILLIIAAFSVVFQNSSQEISKIYDYIKKHNLIKTLNKIVDVLKSIKTIYQLLKEKIGKTVNFLTDMVAYTAIFTPLLLLFSKMISNGEITSDFLIKTAISIGTGVLTTVVKNFIKEVYFKIKDKIINRFGRKNEQIVEKLNNLDLFTETYIKK